MTESSRVSIKISGQEFVINASNETVEKLTAAARLVEEKISFYQSTGEMDVLRLYLMSAFHLAFDLIGYKNLNLTPEEILKTQEHIDSIRSKILKACGDLDDKRNPVSPS